jgi:gentisate 1,2-dioxygenase
MRRGDKSLEWGPKHNFVAPSWHLVVHEALDGECVLFSFSDRVVQEKLGIWREPRGNA